MTERWAPNPFAEGDLTPPGWRLVGRQDEYARLMAAVRNMTPAIEIHGSRGIGKTALVRRLQAQPELRVIYVDVRDYVEAAAAGDPTAASRYVVQGILEQAAFDFELPVGIGIDSGNWNVLRYQVLPSICRSDGPRIVVVLDELDFLSVPAQKKLVRTLLRSVGMESPPLWLLVVGVSWGSTPTTTLLHQLEPLRLGPLSPAAVSEMLGEFPQHTQLCFDDAAITAVWEQSRGYPLFLATLLSHLYEIRREHNDLSTITRVNVDDAVTRLEHQPRGRIAHALRQAGPAAQKLLYVLADPEREALSTPSVCQVFSKEWPLWTAEVVPTLEALHQNHLLSYERGVWSISIPLLLGYARQLSHTEVISGDRPPRPEAWAANQIGEEAERRGDETVACEVYREAAVLDPQFWLARWNWARLVTKRGMNENDLHAMAEGRELLENVLLQVPDETRLAEQIRDVYCAVTVKLAAFHEPGAPERIRMLALLQRGNNNGLQPPDPELRVPGARDLRSDDLAIEWDNYIKKVLPSQWGAITREKLFGDPLVGLDRLWIAITQRVVTRLARSESQPNEALDYVREVIPVLIDHAPTVADAETSTTEALWTAFIRWLDIATVNPDIARGAAYLPASAWEALLLRSPSKVTHSILAQAANWFATDLRQAIMEGDDRIASRLAHAIANPGRVAPETWEEMCRLRTRLLEGELLDIIDRSSTDEVLRANALAPLGMVFSAFEIGAAPEEIESIQYCVDAFADLWRDDQRDIAVPLRIADAWYRLLDLAPAHPLLRKIRGMVEEEPRTKDELGDWSELERELNYAYTIERRVTLRLPGFKSQLSTGVMEAYLAREKFGDEDAEGEHVLIRRFRLHSRDIEVARLLQALWGQERRALASLSLSPEGLALLRYRNGLMLSDGDTAAIVTQWVGDTTLRDVLAGIPASRTLRERVGRQEFWSHAATLIRAIDLLHRHRLLHRAICPDVVYVTRSTDNGWQVDQAGVNPVFRLGHFEWSVYLRAIASISPVGLRDFTRYLAPEALRSALAIERSPRGESFASDAYSLGLTLFECLVRPLSEGELMIYRTPGAYDEKEERSHRDWLSSLRDEVDRAWDVKKIDADERTLVNELLQFELQKRRFALDRTLERAERIATTILQGQDAAPFILHTTLTARGGGDPRSDERCIASYLARSLGEVSVASAEELSPQGLGSILQRELEGARVYLNRNFRGLEVSVGTPETALAESNAGTFPLLLESRNGLLLRITPLKRDQGGIVDHTRGWLEVVRWWEGDAKEGRALAQINKIKIFDVAADPPAGTNVSSWETLFAKAEAAKGQLASSSTEFGRREQLLRVLRISVEAELDLGWSEVPYQKLDAGGSLLRSPKPGANLAKEVEAFIAHDLVVECARERAPLDSGEMISLTPEKLDFDAGLVDVGEDGPSIPDHGVIRAAGQIGTMAMYKRRKAVLRQVEDDAFLLDMVVEPRKQQRVPRGASPALFLPQLDEDKIRVLNAFLRNSLLVVQGPPGVGKTTLATEAVLQSLAGSSPDRILITTQSHVPLDNLLERLQQEAIRNPRAQRVLNEVEIVRVRSGQRLEDEYPEVVQGFLPDSRAERLHRELVARAKGTTDAKGLTGEVSRVLMEYLGPTASLSLRRRIEESANVVFMTTNARQLEESVPGSFDLVIVEEAARSVPVEILGAMRLARRWLLIGDYEQLPPFGFDNIAGEVARRYSALSTQGMAGSTNGNQNLPGLQVTETIIDRYMRLFEHLHKAEPRAGAPHRDTLRTQWRMHPVLGEMVSTVFYDGKSVCNPEDPAELAALTARCIHPFTAPRYLVGNQILWVDFDPVGNAPECGEQRSPGGQIDNNAERRTLVALLRELVSRRASRDLAILSPYRAQVEQLQGLLEHGGNKEQWIHAFGERGVGDRVFTVDSFQGRQAGTIVVSLVRNNGNLAPRQAVGFLEKKERSTVMFSRAEKLLIVLGCSEHFKRFPQTQWISQIYDRASHVHWTELLPSAERVKLIDRHR